MRQPGVIKTTINMLTEASKEGARQMLEEGKTEELIECMGDVTKLSLDTAWDCGKWKGKYQALVVLDIAVVGYIGYYVIKNSRRNKKEETCTTE